MKYLLSVAALALVGLALASASWAQTVGTLTMPDSTVVYAGSASSVDCSSLPRVPLIRTSYPSFGMKALSE